MCEKNFALETQVLENKELIKDIYKMQIRYPKELIKEISPGKFLNVYLKREDLLLPRPISICKTDDKANFEADPEEDHEINYETGDAAVSLVYKVVGEGTEQMSLYKAGESIKVSRPLGNGYDISKNLKEAWLIGGGLGIPPLLELAYALKTTGCFLNIILGYRDQPFLAEEFAELLVEPAEETVGEPAGKLFIISEEEGHGLKGNVMDVLEQEFKVGSPENGFGLDSGFPIGSIFASGPIPMLEAVSNYCPEKNVDLQVSLEERMGCGFGACLGCVRKIREGNRIVSKRVCKDGPVFDGRKVVWHG